MNLSYVCPIWVSFVIISIKLNVTQFTLLLWCNARVQRALRSPLVRIHYGDELFWYQPWKTQERPSHFIIFHIGKIITSQIVWALFEYNYEFRFSENLYYRKHKLWFFYGISHVKIGFIAQQIIYISPPDWITLLPEMHSSSNVQVHKLNSWC